jgi:endoglucanase
VSYALINEPNFMSTMTWWSAAQAAVTAIRKSGATTPIYIPGLGYTAASNWTQSGCYGCDTDTPARSNAYGWLNANGAGKPISDPLDNIAAEVHTYLDSEQSGDATDITSVTAARDQISITVNEAAAHGYQVYLGEIGMLATVTTDDGHPASDAWADFISYANSSSSTLIGYTWWAGGYPPWWNDVGANGGGHFSISPTSYPATGPWSGDTVNMTMIEGDF